MIARAHLLAPAICLLLAGATFALDVDMDPVPRFPLRKDDTQVFLIHLSGAKAACKGTVRFDALPEGLAAEPASQDFSLAPGEAKLLTFSIACTAWGPDAVVRPTVAADGGEAVNFPAEYRTTLVRDAKMLDKKPLNDEGLLAYYSCGDAEPGEYTHFDASAGNPRFWEEGIWYHDGGVKGRAVFGMNALPYPRHRWSKMAYETLNNIYHKRGTICFWIRKSRRPTEIPYAPSFKGDPATTWKIGPNAMRGSEGEGILGHIWSPQSIYVRWFLKAPRPWNPFKPGSDCFLGMRRYKAVGALTDGFLEATCKAMRGDIYHVQAPYKWTGDWRHVALVWDEEKGRLEIWLDGELASGKLMRNGLPTTDTQWYSAPWHLATFCNAGMSICCVSAEGGRGATDRDEYYVYNHALSAEEIRKNMRASMGSVPTPTLSPAPGKFTEVLAVPVRGLWANPVHHYTLDGAEPTEASPVYAGPLSIILRQTTTVKVKSFLAGYTPSRTATATYEYLGPDTTKPRVKQAASINTPDQVMVCFDEPVEKSTAESAANYAMAGNEVKAAALDPDLQVVRLTLARPLGEGEQTLKVKGVRDRSTMANQMDEATVTFRPRTMDGLVGYWSFDVLDGETVKDLSPSRIDGTAWHDQYAEATRVEGVRGRAILLDGENDLVDLADYLDAARLEVNPKSPHNLETGSIVCWFKADPTLLGWRKAIVAKNFAYDVYVASGNLMNTKIKVADGQWHHMAFTFANGVKDGTTVYLDGKPVVTTTMKFLNNSREGLGLGVGGGGYGQPKFFKGAIDEVMLFNRVLTAGQVQELMKASAAK